MSTTKRTEPEFGTHYWFITTGGMIDDYTWNGDSVDRSLFEAGNWFADRKEAERVVEKFKLILSNPTCEITPPPLPDWVQVGSWVLDNEGEESECAKIVDFRQDNKLAGLQYLGDPHQTYTVPVKDLLGEGFTPAKVSPLSNEDMIALVGKVLCYRTSDDGRQYKLVTKCTVSPDGSDCAITCGGRSYEAGSVMNLFTCDGKPLAKIEPLSE